jgi:hypothetical protein
MFMFHSSFLQLSDPVNVLSLGLKSKNVVAEAIFVMPALNPRGSVGMGVVFSRLVAICLKEGIELKKFATCATALIRGAATRSGAVQNPRIM